MLKKPEKKKLIKFNPNSWDSEGYRLENELDKIYNLACSKWEAYHKQEVESYKETIDILMNKPEVKALTRAIGDKDV